LLLIIVLTCEDNTNPAADTRARWVDLARKHKVPIRCFWFKTLLQLCEHNAVVRAMNQTVCGGVSI
jgi:bifunctional polynucleotide phosphatase/kinase